MNNWYLIWAPHVCPHLTCRPIIKYMIENQQRNNKLIQPSHCPRTCTETHSIFYFSIDLNFLFSSESGELVRSLLCVCLQYLSVGGCSGSGCPGYHRLMVTSHSAGPPPARHSQYEKSPRRLTSGQTSVQTWPDLSGNTKTKNTTTNMRAWKVTETFLLLFLLKATVLQCSGALDWANQWVLSLWSWPRSRSKV